VTEKVIASEAHSLSCSLCGQLLAYAFGFPSPLRLLHTLSSLYAVTSLKDISHLMPILLDLPPSFRICISLDQPPLAPSIHRNVAPQYRPGEAVTGNRTRTLRQALCPQPGGIEIVVQHPPEPPKLTHNALLTSNALVGNFHLPSTTITTTATTQENTLTTTTQLVYSALQQFQSIYNEVSKSEADKITIGRTTFEEIGEGFASLFQT
jgi:hypothetical protein